MSRESFFLFRNRFGKFDMPGRMLVVILAATILLSFVVVSKWFTPAARVSGFIEADEIRVGSRVGGRVAEVFVTEGQMVEAGQVLVELEPYDLLERESELKLLLAARESEYQLYLRGYRPEEILQARAKLQQLQAQLDLLREGPRPQEIEAARGRLALAQAEQKLAQQGYDRITQLKNAQAVSQQERDSAREALQAADANVSVRLQELSVLESGTRPQEIQAAEGSVEQARQALQLMENGYRQEEIEQAKSSRDAAEARVQAIQRQKQELMITSPTAGTVESLDLQPGDMVAPGAPVLALLDNHALWVRAYVPNNRADIQVGHNLRVTVDGLPEEAIEGRVTFIARRAEFTPSNVQTPDDRAKQVFRIKVAVENTSGKLRPGMLADVWLDRDGDRE